MADSSEPVEAAQLAAAGAMDAIPLLRALGRPVAEFDWHEQVADRRSLAAGRAAPSFGHLLALEESAASGNRAETLLLAAVALGTAKPWHLGRDDAARIVGALARAGLEGTARGLAREILAGWALERHFAGAGGADAGTG